MRLSDFINKEQEKTAMQSVGKSELVAYLVKGLHSEIAESAKETYEMVCSDIAKKIVGGSRNITGIVSPRTGTIVNELPAEFEKLGTKELRAKIKEENDIAVYYDDTTGGDYGVSFFKIVPTKQKHAAPSDYGYGSGGYRTTAAKIVKTRLGNEYENEVRRFLAQDGIKCEFKVAVTTWKDTDALKWAGIDKKRKVTKKYIDIGEEYSYSWFGNEESLELQLHYSYSHK